MNWNPFKILTNISRSLAKNKLLQQLFAVKPTAESKETHDKISELIIWIVFAFLPIFYIVLLNIRYRSSPVEIYESYPGLFIYVFVIAIIPGLFRLIFGDLPIATMRKSIARKRELLEISHKYADPNFASDVATRKSILISKNPRMYEAIEASELFSPREQLAWFAYKSAETASDVYRRAGIYILTGVVISFSGLIFFYFRSIDVPKDVSFYDHILYLFPSFGVLFFIELVAFFFLRQYRLAMDEFRYFEYIKRLREENLIILKMFSENPTITSTKDVLSVMNIYSQPAKFSKEESSDILESRKLTKDELGIFEKIIELASRAKNNKDHNK